MRQCQLARDKTATRPSPAPASPYLVWSMSGPEPATPGRPGPLLCPPPKRPVVPAVQEAGNAKASLDWGLPGRLVEGGESSRGKGQETAFRGIRGDGLQEISSQNPGPGHLPVGREPEGEEADEEASASMQRKPHHPPSGPGKLHAGSWKHWGVPQAFRMILPAFRQSRSRSLRREYTSGREKPGRPDRDLEKLQWTETRSLEVLQHQKSPKPLKPSHWPSTWPWYGVVTECHRTWKQGSLGFESFLKHL
ncbi:uncharacterized protein [Notamacropus eugenii]|uniref:uncharacterized protein isoform X2 n=1 Tax=Notamacropus eugenii TaxID=9315 RepID=UPI003B67C34A